MINKVRLIYFSATGTTEKIIKEVGRALDLDTEILNITLTQKREEIPSFKDNELLILACPVYAGRIPAFLSEYFRGFEGRSTPLVSLVLYGNRAYDDALVELKDIFESRGFINIAAGAFVGEHSYTTELAKSRPDEKDLNLAYDFGLRIKTFLDRGDFKSVRVPGNRPYRSGMVYKHLMINTSQACIDCGLCRRRCPRQAISLNNRDIDLELCIRCCKCIKSCPTSAKAIEDQSHLDFLREFVNTYSKPRKKPEIFI